MPTAVLASETDFAGWRTAARAFRLADVPPEATHWSVGGDLFGVEEPPAPISEPFSVPTQFLSLAEAVICHRHPGRFELLYRLLYRLRQGPELLQVYADDDVAEARSMARQVSKASHKMKAFVRFRQLDEAYVAWFEPAHRVLERTAPFFMRRFANHRFSILTPDLCAHWCGEALRFTPGADRSAAPAFDAVEDDWKAYYASIFNPARLKIRAMQAEMPKRYWRNLPEAALIPSLIEKAARREDAMIKADPVQPRKRAPRAPPVVRAPVAEGAVPVDLADIARTIQTCRRCDLWRNATQGVPGQGPSTAKLMLVGEQPGDQEDLAGEPFVGPAGQMLDRALTEAGVPRGEAYVTNAVKHFKHEPRGKRRLHKTPDTSEVVACRWWLDHERRLVRPRLILALGATAALSVLGRPTPIARSRGQVFQLEDQALAMVTMHPSYLLRIPDADEKAKAYRRLVEDLTQAWQRATV